MESINAWLDVEELNKLAKALMQPVSSSSDAFDELNSAARDRASKLLEAAKANAQSAGMIDFPGQGVEKLGRWLSANGGNVTGLCVIGPEERVLFESLPHSVWRSLVQQLAKSAITDEQNTRLKVGQDYCLQLLRFTVGDEYLQVGLLINELLNDQKLSEFREIVSSLHEL